MPKQPCDPEDPWDPPGRPDTSATASMCWEFAWFRMEDAAFRVQSAFGMLVSQVSGLWPGSSIVKSCSLSTLRLQSLVCLFWSIWVCGFKLCSCNLCAKAPPVLSLLYIFIAHIIHSKFTHIRPPGFRVRFRAPLGFKVSAQPLPPAFHRTRWTFSLKRCTLLCWKCQ